MENHHFQWVNPYKWSYSIAMLNYQRVPLKTLVKGRSKDSTTRPQPKAGTLAFYVRYLFAMVINIHHNLIRLHITYSRFRVWDESPHQIYHVWTMSHLLITYMVYVVWYMWYMWYTISTYATYTMFFSLLGCSHLFPTEKAPLKSAKMPFSRRLRLERWWCRVTMPSSMNLCLAVNGPSKMAPFNWGRSSGWIGIC